MHGEKPNVVRLQVHEENQQPVIFQDDENPQDVLERAKADTTLTGWFKANAKEAEATPNTLFARNLLYQEFPQQFWWDKSAREWKICKRQVARRRRREENGEDETVEDHSASAVGRMYFAHPASGMFLLLSKCLFDTTDLTLLSRRTIFPPYIAYCSSRCNFFSKPAYCKWCCIHLFQSCMWSFGAASR
jgi:hypothetical protein